VAEQIAMPREQGFFDQVLSQAWRETRLLGLLVRWQWFSQPTHRAVEVLQVQFLDVTEGVSPTPTFGRSVAPRREQAMQHANEHHAFQRELKPAAYQQTLQDAWNAELLPQPLKHQRRPDMRRARWDDPIGFQRIEYREVIAELGQRLDQTIEMSRLLEHIQATERGNYPLSHSAIDAFVVYDLDVLMATGLFDASEHGGFHSRR
jgi:hypothetical protein